MQQTPQGEWTELAQNDDCYQSQQDCSLIGNGTISGGLGNQATFRSKTAIQLTANTTYRLIIRSYSSIPSVPHQQTSYFTVSDEGNSAGIAEIWATNTNNQTQSLITGGTRFAGTTIFSNVMGTNSGNLIYETARTPNTPKYTYPEMFLLECGTQKIIKSNTLTGAGFSGVGPNSRLSADNICAIILGTTNSISGSIHVVAPEGPVNVYINDANLPSRDQDQDGLGYKLERDLGSCDRRLDFNGNTIPTCGTTVSVPMTGKTIYKVFNLQDSDGDGIPDSVEVFGLETGNKQTGQQYDYLELARMGASPTTKDIFFEIDYSNDNTEHPFREQEVLFIKAFFEDPNSAMLTEHLNAFPTSAPIRLHFDIGRTPPNTNPAPGLGQSGPSNTYMKTLYGDWGGSNTFTQPVTEQQVQQVGDGPGLPGVLQNAMAPIRNGIFRHIALYTYGNGANGCNGFAGIPSNHTFTGFGPNMSTMRSEACLRVLVHEIGHMLGLFHGGSLFWGADYNGRPMYKSIMNYPFLFSGFFSNDPPTEPTMTPLYDVIYYQYSTSSLSFFLPYFKNVDLSYLGGNPFNLQTQVTSPDMKHSINWSHTNHQTIVDNIRWPPNLVDNNVVGQPTKFGLSGAREIPVSTPNSTNEFTGVKLLKFNPGGSNNTPRMYAFFVRNGRIFYRHGTYTPTPDAARSSCTGLGTGAGMGKPFHVTNDGNNTTTHEGNCTTWTLINNLVPTSQTNIAHINAIDVNSLNGSTHNAILLLYVTTTGELRALASSAINNTTTTTPTPNLQPGEIAWQSNSILVSPNAQGVPEPIRVDGTLSIFYVDNNNDYQRSVLQHTNNITNWTWGAGSTLNSTTGQTLKGRVGPSLVWWPKRAVPGARLCGIFPAMDDQMKMYCLDGTTNTWDDVSIAAFGEAPHPTTIEKPTLIYRKQKRTDGTPIEGNGLYPGHFWLYRVAPGRVINFFVSQELDTNQHTISSFNMNTPMFQTSREHFLGDEQQRRVLPSTTISILYSDEIATTKALVFMETNNVDEDTYPLMILPFADGTANATLKVDSDFKIMDANICRGLQGSQSSFCANAQKTRWGY
jgi:hypothetical protein